MNRETIRAFAFGMLSAALALLVFVQFFQQSDSSMNTQDMINTLKKQGYTISSPGEQKHQPVIQKPIASKHEKQQASPQQTKNATSKNAANVNRTFELRISPGMTPDKIAQILEKANIIHSAKQFSEYINQNRFSQKLQVGTYKLNSQMTIEEITKTITKSK